MPSPAQPPGSSNMRPAWIEIDLTAIADNVHRVLSVLGHQRKLIAVVKDDAYGHGVRAIAPVVCECGAHMLAVALIEEALEAEQICPQAEVLILSLVPHAEAETAVAHGFHVPLSNLAGAEAFARAAAELGKPAKVHIKVDTGMHRLGVPAEQISDYCRQLRAHAGLQICGIFTHFASSSDDPQFTTEQFGRFQRACRDAEAALGYPIPIKHCANSGATVRYPEMWLDAVRPGALLYGIPRNRGGVYLPTMVQALTLKAKIACLQDVPKGETVGYGRTWRAARNTRTALLPVGYGDGYDRLLSNNADVLLRCCRAPVIGTIAMDSTVIDVTDVPGIEVGEEVVLIGDQGDESITVAEIAERCGTIVQEVVARLTRRLPRVYTCQPGDGRVERLIEASGGVTSGVPV